MATILEQFTSQLNAHLFLKEFSFEKNTFRAACGSERELADHVIIFPEQTFVFQLKERNAEAASDATSLHNWFRKKVLGVGCGQLRDSETFLTEQPSLRVRNQRGHTFELAERKGRVTKILLYWPGHGRNVDTVLFKRSQRAGFVHVMHVQDYFEVCRHLAAPTELSQYFAFRERYLSGVQGTRPQERGLVAMFARESDAPLTAEAVDEVLAATLADVPSFDFGRILRRYGETISYAVGDSTQHDYYLILTELARLDRADMRSLKGLLEWALSRAGEEPQQLPCRLRGASGVTFVVLPVALSMFQNRLQGLENFTLLAKYDWKSTTAVGISVSKDGGMVEIDWAYLSGAWTHDPAIEERLRTRYPFRPTPSPTLVYRYPGV